MYSTPFFYTQKWKLFFAAFFFSTLLFGQNFYKTYPQLVSTSAYNIRSSASASASGFEVDTRTGFVNSAAEGVLTTATNGNFQSHQTFDELDNPPYNKISNNRFVKATTINSGADIQYEIFNSSGTVTNSFSISIPTGNVGSPGQSAEFPNGQLFISYYYGNTFNNPSTLGKRTVVFARVTTSGQVIWESNFESNFNVWQARPQLVSINENEEIFVHMNEEIPINQQHFMRKISATGQLLWETPISTLERYPKDLAPSSDGGVWMIYNQVFVFVQKLDATGQNVAAVITDQIFQAGTSRDAIAPTNDGGVMVVGRLGPDLYTLRLDAVGGEVQANVLDNLPTSNLTPMPLTMAHLPSGDYAIGGYLDPSPAFNDNYPFFLTVNQNGEFETGQSGGVDLELSMTANPANPQIWSTTAVTVTISNTGNQNATGVKVHFPRPANTTYQGGNEFDVSKGTFSPWTNQVWNVGTLPAGTSETLTVNYFMLTSDKREPYAQVTAQNEPDADSSPNNGVTPTPIEDDEAVAILNGGITVFYPDLQLADLQCPGIGGAGSVVNFTVDLINAGDATAVEDYIIGAYLASFPNLGNATLVGTINTGNTPVGTLQNVPGAITIPANFTPGDYYLIVKADINGDVFETKPFNNQTPAKPFEVTSDIPELPDLVTQNVVASPNTLIVEPGDGVGGFFDAVNLGTPLTSSQVPFKAQLYLSANSTLDANDFPAGGPLTLGIGDATIGGDLPANIPPGSYFMLIEVDSDHTVFESNENNNVGIAAQKVTVTGGSNDPCKLVVVSTSPGSITISGVDAPNEIIKVFRPNWSTAFSCTNNCEEPVVVTGLGTGPHFVEIKLLDANWQEICKANQTVQVSSGNALIINEFDVSSQEQSVDFVWVNNFGKAVENFEVEHSTDGINFEPILHQNAKNEEGVKVYKNKDTNPSIGQNFYRLKLNMTNGESQFSAMQIVEVQEVAKLELFPNPAGDFVNIHLKNTSKEVLLKVVNLQGLELKSIRLEEYDLPVYQLDLSGIQNGQYFVWVFEGGKRAVSKQLMIRRD